MKDTLERMRGNETSLGTKLMTSLWGGLLLIGSVMAIGLLVGAIYSFPEIKRYLKMRSM
ncbi:MAG: DUF6893 family small protein [Thermomicrobiales bacterium]